MTGFGTTDSVAAAVGHDAVALNEGLQVAPHGASYRPGLTAFRLIEAVDAARAITLANPQFGAGGLEQIYVPNLTGVAYPLVTRLMSGAPK